MEDSTKQFIKKGIYGVIIFVIGFIVLMWYLSYVSNKASANWPPPEKIIKEQPKNLQESIKNEPALNSSISTKTNDQEAQQKTSNPAVPASSSNKEWHEVTTFSGSDTKDTDTFIIKGDRFKLTYTVSPDPEYPQYASFSVYAFEPGSNAYAAYASLDSGTDSTTSYKGSGEYYLKVVAANLKSWSVKVEDYY